MYYKVKENDNLVRDSKSQAVINTSRSEFENAKKRKQASLESQQKQKTLVDDINNLKQEVNDIKSLLQEILVKVG